MIDFVEYVVGELSSKRLAKADALDLIRQFQAPADGQPDAAIGSLLHRNTSGLDQQSYEAVFTGDEPFLRDHVVKGHRILPGVAYLELVRQALAAALPGIDDDAVVELRNVVWAQPIVVDARQAITVALMPADDDGRDGVIDFEIYSVAAGEDGAPLERIHSQGQILVGAPAGEAPRQDFAALRARMTRGRVDADALYAMFDAMGLCYGPAQRAVRRLHQGTDEVLAHLVLPDAWTPADGAFALHPAMMDAALQSALGFADDLDAGAPPARLPYALDRLRMFAPCTGEMVAWLRLSPDHAANARVTRIDIDLCDADGRVCVQWQGFSSRELGGASTTDTAATAVLYAAPAWEGRDVATQAAPFAERHVLACGALGALAAALPGMHGHAVADDASADPAVRYQSVALACFDWLRARLDARPSDPVLLQLVVADDSHGELLTGLAGMLRSATLENPLLAAQIVLAPADASAADLDGWLRAASGHPRDTVQRVGRDGLHRAIAWREIAAPAEAPSAFRDDGVYLITGGLGGLGALFAREILSTRAGTTVVLTGRASADAAQPRRDALARAVADDLRGDDTPDGGMFDAARLAYVTLDLDDADAVRAGIEGIVQRHGRIDGILHCAGCLRDGFILRKQADDVREVLAPKVAGTRHLDLASRALALDFMVLFSGGASVTGNPGQADYAAANGFMDRYAAYRNVLVADGRCHGTTRAINWPLWREGGMGVSAETLEQARRVAGIEPLDTAAGLAAFHRALALPHDQVQVVQGDAGLLRRALFGAPAPAPRPTAAQAAPAADALREPARAFIRQKLSGLLKLPAHQIETDAPFEKYGINSIMMMNLTNALEEAFGSLPKTLFFEYQTLGELTEYFLVSHAPALATLLDRTGAAAPAAPVQAVDAAPALATAVAMPAASRAARRRQRFAGRAREDGRDDGAGNASRHHDPIAIVGLSGRYPGARDVDAYWRNLRDGVDSIQEVPADRWDWREYFSEDRTQPGHHFSKWGGFIEGVDEFDALFFNIPPVDAERIDPQERVFLQHAWMAVEDAGYTRASLQIPHGTDQAGQVGVYVGVMYGEYQLFGAEASLLGDRGVTPSSYASIANRVSYFMNLHGPSLALDTMCSSSLTAIHLACQDLREGRTDLAIAGGVNLSIHPNKYLLLSSGQFIATDGRCQSFGEGGDGYIPAEGAGAVVLKRLSEARRDGNHVYGVIRGSALNHGGKTNGYSVPNPQSQANVIAMAMQACGVDARRIGYIEAHGTGTKLGDPIEIAALTSAFRKHTPDSGFCLIGSAKSNIGHAESAAGIAGLTKVLLQMKHGMVAPSLHATVLNPHIDFDKTPFEVNRVLRPWTRMQVDGRDVPRLAGLSSFGAGGANAHLIVEEYLPEADATGDGAHAAPAAGPHAVLLSARSAEQLDHKVRDLLAFVDGDGRDVVLADLAHTLQTGREAMEERLALVVESIEDLRAGLRAWLEDRLETVRGHRGRADAGGGALALFNTDSDLQATVARWFDGGRLDRVLDVWVQGVSIDWRKAHDHARRPRLVSLPAYPFARDRCWVERVRPVRAGLAARLHPLLHANVSDLHGQAYRSTFGGHEFFLDDHRVRIGDGPAQRLMPGVAYLEMMRAAAALAVPGWGEGGLALSDIAWTRPLPVAASTEVTVALSPEDHDALAITVGTAIGGDAVVHCSGRVREATGQAPPAPLALEPLLARMARGTLGAEDLYARYARLGIEYGRSFRSVAHVRMGTDEVLAQLQLPAAAAVSEDLWLHPALLDGALQSAIGLLVAAGHDVDQVPLPFAVRSVRVLAPCAGTSWAWVRPATTQGMDAAVVELDIDVCDADGRVSVELRGLASRPLRREAQAPVGLVMAAATWERAAVPSPLPPLEDGWRGELLLCDLPGIDPAALATAAGLADGACRASNALPGSALSDDGMPDDGMPADGVHAGGMHDGGMPENRMPDDGAAARYRQHAQALLALLQAAPTVPATRRWLQVVVPGEGDAGDPSQVLSGLHAMLRTAAMENPAIRAQIVRVPADADLAALAGHLRAATALRHEPVIAFGHDGPRVSRWQLLPDDDAAAGAADTSPFCNDGVYLITGGMGGLGQVFARHILARAAHARVVLTGRGALDAVRQARFDALAAATAASDGRGRLHYRELDLSADAPVRAGVDAVVAEFGGLHGVLHSAGFSRDGLLPTRTASLLDEVLAPKVAGTRRLDEATAHLDLDVFALFASVSGALGNVGQADYAAANGFLDRFAALRDARVAAGLRRGRSVSIDWPLWAEGGMGLEASAADLLWRTAGVRALPTAAGLAAFERSLLQVTAPQVLVLWGDVPRLRQLLLPRPPAPVTRVADADAHAAATGSRPVAATAGAATTAGPATAADAASGEGRAQAWLRGIFSRVLKVPAHRIDAKASLEQYGIDSVVAMTLTAELEKDLGELPKTLLFEHQSVERLARHLQATFPQRLRELSGDAADGARTVPAATSAAPAPAARSQALPLPNRFRTATPAPARRVAIVGAAGRYPQARTLDRFWDNLRAGRDCIGEVPAGRWDHARYFDPARNRPGKTYSRWGGFLEDVDTFDALFFNVSPREAELVDPQERIFLETAWEAIEDAGYSRERLAGQRVGVYVGVMWGHYELYAGDASAGIPTSSHASIANRVSYVFDFHGPSLALDTMCSSSLSAVHLAAEEIRRGTIDAALVGGVNLSLHPQKYLNLSQGNFISSDGRCRSFGAGGDGYVPGEGAGALLLKPLDDALRDGDQVYAVIEASALNHGGKTHGYTVPNPVAQAELIAGVLKAADIDPRGIGYIETHGTGTSLGDPIELAGLRQAFAGQVDETGACAIGSVKSNIGHLEAAAGIAALTKALLQMRHGELVPSLHAEPPNPHIDFASSPFRVQTALAPWPRRDGQPRRAAVSAFGAGGANAHLVLVEHIDTTHRDGDGDDAGTELFVLSARDEAALARYAARMVDFLDGAAVPALRDIAHTSQVGRSALPVRLAVLADTSADLRAKLARWAAQATAPGAARATGEDLHAGRVVDAGAGGLIAGDTGQAFLDDLLARQDWRALARLWVAGADVDWSRRAASQARRRVSLPTYPFAPERHWVGGRTPAQHAAIVAGDALAAGPVTVAVPARTLAFRPDWVAQPLAAPALAIDGPVLVLGATAQWRDALAARLGAVAVIGVDTGEAFAVVSDTRITIDPAREDDIDALVAALQASGRMPRVVIHRQADARLDAGDPAAVAAVLDRDAHLPVALAAALMRHRHAGETRFLSLVSAPTALARAPAVALGGFYASLHREHPAYRAKVVEIIGGAGMDQDDLDIAVAELGQARWTSQVLRMRVRQGEGTAVRELRRWAPLPAMDLSAEVADTGARLPLKQGGVYVISGGMGALGRLLAESLARRFKARLVLLGRSPLDAGIALQLDALHALGGEALYVPTEVADLARTRAAMAQARQRFGRIDGVLHVAGVHRDAFLLKKTRADREAVFAPKVLGALHLDHATADDALDLFVCFASVAGALGNAGQTDYAYANHFLDAFAHARAGMVAQGLRHGRTLSIDWPLWAADGMRPDEAVIAASARAGLLPLPADAGLALWERLLSGQDTQAMVLHGDPAKIDAALRALDGGDSGRAPVAAASGDGAGTAGLADLAQAWLKARIGEEIRLDPDRIDAHERFDAFGIDSMMVARLNERLAADLGDLPKTLFYEHASVAELADHLVREVPGPLSALLHAGAPMPAHDVPAAPVRAVAAPASVAEPVPRDAAPVEATPAGRAPPAADEPIAIIGMHGLYPQSPDLDALWAHLRDGEDLIGGVPADRWDAEAFHDPDPANAANGRIYCKWGAFLDGHDRFDPDFFRIGQAEAASIDPQERLFLQSVWAAFEDAGLTRAQLKARYPKGKGANVGVYVGVTTNSYQLLGAERWQDGEGASPSSLPWSIANRVSYVFDFQGASLPVDTACSSSLVAIHMACDSLRRGDAAVAVAGGVNLYLHPAKYHGLCQRRMLALHGKCRSYGDGDDGFVPGEGVGSLVLKTLSQARRDGDRIHGLITASGQGHSGRSNGYSAPNPTSQAALVGEVLRGAGIDAASIGYVEGHGTGTQLGDSLEVRALAQAFGAAVPAQSCALGSIKANLGHTESAAGVLGVTKVLLQMRHRQIAPTLHSDPVNPNIAFERTPFRLQTRLAPWDTADGQPRRALVNAFGAGGVNACLVLEEYVPQHTPHAPAAGGDELFVLSARDGERLRAYAQAWIDHLRGKARDADLPAIAHVLRTGREAMPERLALVAGGVEAIATGLQAWLNGEAGATYHARADANRPARTRRDDEGMLTALVRAHDLHAMARAWVQGADVPWQAMAATGGAPLPATLPTYPFATERHWPAFAPRGAPLRVAPAVVAHALEPHAPEPHALEPHGSAPHAAPTAAVQLHPLVSHNASNLWETRYTSLLSREAFYAADHRVNDQRILPGSAWLEIARATGALAAMAPVRRIRDIVFVRPLAFDEPVQVAVTTLRATGEEVTWTIASHDPRHGTVVHCEGVLDCGDAHGEPARLPVEDLQRRATRHIDGDACYARFRLAGLDYGPAFRTVQALHVGEGFVLARLSLAPSLVADAGEFGLHPSLIDGALQAVSGFAGEATAAGPFLPFAIDEVALHGLAPAECIVHVVETTRPRPGRDDLRKFDIAVATGEGAVVVCIKGLTVRSLTPVPSGSNTLSSECFS